MKKTNIETATPSINIVKRFDNTCNATDSRTSYISWWKHNTRPTEKTATVTATANTNRNSKGMTADRVQAINEKYGLKLFLTYEEEKALANDRYENNLAYLEKASTIEKARQKKQEKTKKPHKAKSADYVKTIANPLGYTPTITTTINAYIERIYDKPDTIPFSACSNLMEWVAVNNIHVAIAHNAVKWHANRDATKHPTNRLSEQYTDKVARSILNGENLVYCMDDCNMDCFAGLQTYANEHGEKACFTLENDVVTLEHDFISSGFRAVSNGMRNNASVQGIHETAIEVKNERGEWIEVALSPCQLGKNVLWGDSVEVSAIVDSILSALPTKDHKKWLLMRLAGEKKTDIQRALCVSRQKCRELEKVVISTGKTIVEYADLWAYADRKQAQKDKPAGVYVRDLMKTDF